MDLSALPRDNEDLDTGALSDQTMNSQAVSHTEVSTDEVLEMETTDKQTPDDPDVPEVGIETTINEQSNGDQNDNNHHDSDEKEPMFSGRSIAYCHAIEDARDKHFKVKLSMLTNAELEHYLNMKPDNDI